MWGRRFRHCCVAVSKSRGWSADFPWLVHVWWAPWGVGEGARTLARRAGVRVFLWALGAPPAARVAWAALLRGASGARRSPSSGCPPPGGCPGPPATCCGHGCAGVGAEHCPLGLHALWGLRAAGVVAFPAPAPQRGALASRRCVLWGRQKRVPGGRAFRHCGKRLSSGASPSPAARLLGELPGPATRVLWARVGECGGPALSTWLACPMWGCVSRGWWGAVPRGGAQCQALSLPLPPVLWDGQPGFRDPCVVGAVGARVETQYRPHSVRPSELSLRAAGVAEGRPRESALRRCEARLRPGAPPPPGCPHLGRAGGVRYPRAVGAGVRGWGPSTIFLACVPCEGVEPPGWRGAVPRGGWPATVVRGVWCRALSLPRPPVLWGGQPGFRDPRVPGAVGVGVGTQHLPHGVRPCRPALRAAGVAEGRPRGGCLSPSEVRRSPSPRLSLLWAGCQGPLQVCCRRGCAGEGAQRCALGLHALWGLRAAEVAGGRPRWGWPATVVTGVWCEALSLPRPPVLWGRQPGFRNPCVPGAVGVGLGTQHRPHSVRLCGPALRGMGGDAFRRFEGRLRSGASLPPTAGPSGRAVGEAGSDPRGHLGVTWGVYLCAGKPPLADIILSHPPELTRCDSVIGLAIPATSGHIQYGGAAS